MPHQSRARLRLTALAATVVLGPLAAAAAPAATATAAPAPSPTRTLTGVLHRSIADPPPGSGRRPTVQVTVTAGGTTLPVATDLAGRTASGTPVSVTVATPGRSGTASVSAGGAQVVAVHALAAPTQPSQAGTHHLTIVPVYWQTSAVPDGQPTQADLTAAAASVDDYYNQTTGGALRVTTDQVLPWQDISATVPAGTTGCPYQAVLDAAHAAAGDLPADQMHHLVVYFPTAGGCSFDGLALVGPGSNGWILLNGADGVDTFAHELGHNLGLEHSGLLDCWADAARTAPVPLSGTCGQDVYDDPWDIMGNSPMNHVGFMSAAHLDQIGALPAGATQVVSASTQVHLAPLESGSGLRGVTIPLPGRTYTLEYRTPTGLDSWINDATETNADGVTTTTVPAGGVVVRVQDQDAQDPTEQDVVNFHPDLDNAANPGDIMNPGLQAGQSWTSADGTLGFQVDAADATGATVSLTVPADATPPDPVQIYSPQPGDVADSHAVDVSWGPVTDAQSGVAGVDVQIDGKVVRTVTGDLSNGGDTTVDGLPDGWHTLRLLARDQAGNVQANGPVRFAVDTTAPVVSSAPRAVLRGGLVSTTALPVTVSWAVSDLSGVTAQTLWGTPAVVGYLNPSPSARSVGTWARPGARNSWELNAVDTNDNERYATGPSTVAAIDGVSIRSRAFTGAWVTARSRYDLGGSEQLTARAGSRLTYVVTARSIGYVATKATNRGQVAVYLDGRRVATVDLYSRATAARQQVWTAAWPTAGRHTLTLVALGTRGRPTIGVDAITRLS